MISVIWKYLQKKGVNALKSMLEYINYYGGAGHGGTIAGEFSVQSAAGGKRRHLTPVPRENLPN
jgi:hypothetical protein